MEQTEDLKEKESPQEENIDLEDKTYNDGEFETEYDVKTISRETNIGSKHNGEINDTETINQEKDEHLQDENQESENETDRQNQPLVTSETIVLESEKDSGHDEESDDDHDGPQDEAETIDNHAEKSTHVDTFEKDIFDGNTDGAGIESTNGNVAEEVSLEEGGHPQCPRLESSHSLAVNVGSLQHDDSDAEATGVEDGPSELELNQQNEIEDVDDNVKDDDRYQVEDKTRESPEVFAHDAAEDRNKESVSHESELVSATGIHRSAAQDSNDLFSQDFPPNESNELSVESQLDKEDYSNEDDLENLQEASQVDEDTKSSNIPNDNSEICHHMKYKSDACIKGDSEPKKKDSQQEEEEVNEPIFDEKTEVETNVEVEDQSVDSGDDEAKDAEETDQLDMNQKNGVEDFSNQDEFCPSSETEVESEGEGQDDIIADNSEELEELSKVKEIGKIFQHKDETPLASKESQAEKSPVSVRRYKEIFEHGELLLSPAAYNAVPDSEVSSPRPGIVKTMCDLFENPKNFEWPEGTKRTTAVN